VRGLSSFGNAGCSRIGLLLQAPASTDV